MSKYSSPVSYFSLTTSDSGFSVRVFILIALKIFHFISTAVKNPKDNTQKIRSVTFGYN